jgi:hypothetical protein
MKEMAPTSAQRKGRAPRHSLLPRPFRSGWLRFAPSWLIEERGPEALNVPSFFEAFRELARLARSEEKLSSWARGELEAVFRALTGKPRKNRPKSDPEALLRRFETLEKMTGEDYFRPQWGGGFIPGDATAHPARPLGRRNALHVLAHETGQSVRWTELQLSEARSRSGRRLRKRKERR